MARPTTRESFKEYCLRSLGAPVIDINVDDEQLEDRIDDALQYYRDYHFDGTEHTYFKHLLTQSDITNQYISITENIQGIVRIFPLTSAIGSANMFDVRYQFFLNDLSNLTTNGMANYVSAKRNIELLEEIFVGQKPIRFNRHTNKLYIDMDWVADVLVGNYLIIDCYTIVDPETYTDVWSDRWLTRYTTALFKRQWGNNITKFAGVQLPGGITLDGNRILAEAVDEIKIMEDEMINSYSPLVYDMTN